MNVRRAPLLLLLAVLLVAAVIAGNARASSRPVSVSPDVASMPARDAQSTAWYCPGAPPAIGVANETLTLSNLGAAETDAEITVMPDGDKPAVVHVVHVAARHVLTVRRATLGPAGALVVQAYSPDVAVESSVESSHGLALTPCATRASTEWQFSAGMTPRGVSQYLVVDDPFAADAKVDIILRTSQGLRLPEPLQSFDVARRSRAVIPIHNYAVRENLVAVEVRARVGQVVAQQTLVFNGDSPPQGVAVSSGALRGAREWWFADDTTAAGAADAVVIANVGTSDTDVDVQALPDGNVALGPVTVAVPRDTVVRVPLGACRPGPSAPCVPVPARSGDAVRVRAERDVPIVAEIIQRFAGPQPIGDAIATGVTSAPRSWTFARSRVAREHSAGLAIVNPGTATAVAKVALVQDGIVDEPASMQHLTVAPGRRIVVDLTHVSGVSAHDAAVIVTANVPIVAERDIAGPSDATRTAGITVRTGS